MLRTGNRGPERQRPLASVEELVGWVRGPKGYVSPFPLIHEVGPGPEAEAALNSDPQEASRPGAPGSERILLDILEHDWREAQDSRQELCQKLLAVQGELQWAEELRDKVVSTARQPLPPPCPHLPSH